MFIYIFFISLFLHAEQNFRFDLEKLLQQSAFAQSTPPENLIPRGSYNPILLSVVASLKSRQPERDPRRWKEIRLKATANSSCSGEMRAYIKRSHARSPSTFIILPGSYATWTRGSFVNQTSASLANQFGDPNLIAFDGYLTKTFLSNVCDQIPWDGKALSYDLYNRLRATVPKLLRQVGVVGFSGGANLALGLLSADAKSEHPIFKLGGAVFSPVLHGRSVYQTLDTEYSHSQINRSHRLTSLDLYNLQFVLRHFRLPDWTSVGELYAQDPREFSARFYNEFRHDLDDARAAINLPATAQDGYYQSFVLQGFAHGQSSSHMDQDYDAATDLHSLSVIDRPLLIYFSKDDPVLSGSRSQGQPEIITQLLQDLRVKPNIVVFNPEFGGHTGALVDPIFNQILKVVLTPRSP